MKDFSQWRGFKGKAWRDEIDTRDFIQDNYTPYEGNEDFLEGPTEATEKLWGKLSELQKEERAKGGVLDMDTKIVTGINSHAPGYIDPELKDLEKVVGLQTDKPLKRAFMPFGGIKMAEEACETYGYTPDPELHKIFTEYHKTHNQGVFDAYTRDETYQKEQDRNRSSRHLRKRKNRRRLQENRPLRYRYAYRKEAGGLC